MAIPDFDLLAKADADAATGIRGRWRTLRRLVQRSLFDRDVRNQTRFFCQNSGACGSHYIVDLLNENGVDRAFHEKDPDLNEIGVQHFDSPLPQSKGGPVRFFIPDHAQCNTEDIDECANVKFVDHMEFTSTRGFDNRPTDEEEHAKLHEHE